MAIKLLDKPNVESVSYDYPYGNIKDNPGDNTGTPVNKLVYADFHQFFAKMMAESGIVYNDQPDNATDGFQYWLALIEAVKNNCDFYEDISVSLTVNPLITVSTFRAKKYADGTVSIYLAGTYSGAISANTNLITGLPLGNITLNSIRAYITNSLPATAFIDLVFLVNAISTLSSISGSFDNIVIGYEYKII